MMQSALLKINEASPSSLDSSRLVPMDEISLSRTSSMQRSTSDSESFESMDEEDSHMQKQVSEKFKRQNHRGRPRYKDSHASQHRSVDHEEGPYHTYEDEIKPKEDRGQDDPEDCLDCDLDEDFEDEWALIPPATPSPPRSKTTFTSFPTPLPPRPSRPEPAPLSARLTNSGLLAKGFARKCIAKTKTAARTALPMAKTAIPVAMEVGKEAFETAREVYEAAVPVGRRMRENWPAVKHLAGVIAFGEEGEVNGENDDDDDDADDWEWGERHEERMEPPRGRRLRRDGESWAGEVMVVGENDSSKVGYEGIQLLSEREF